VVNQQPLSEIFHKCDEMLTRMNGASYGVITTPLLCDARLALHPPAKVV
jgi:hypothetical protein